MGESEGYPIELEDANCRGTSGRGRGRGSGGRTGDMDGWTDVWNAQHVQVSPEMKDIDAFCQVFMEIKYPIKASVTGLRYAGSRVRSLHLNNAVARHTEETYPSKQLRAGETRITSSCGRRRVGISLPDVPGPEKR